MRQSTQNTIGFALALWMVLLLAVLTLGGCASATDESMSDGDMPSDGDSVADGDEPSGTIGVELTPPSELGLLTQQVPEINLESFDGVIMLKPTYTYSGEVRLPDGEPVESTITLAPSGLNMISGRPLPNISGSTNELSDFAPKSEFTLSTLAGLYTLYVFPKQDWENLVPPIVQHDSLVVESDSFDVLWYERGLEVRGIVRNGDGVALPLVKVTAFASDPWLRSSVALTSTGLSGEAALGEFVLLVSTTPGTYSLVVQGSNQDPLKPRLTVENVFSVENNRVQLLSESNDDLLHISYEPFNNSTCLMNGQVKGYDGQPIAGAKLSFVAAIGGGSFSATATTDEVGAFSLDLLRSDGQVTSDDYTITVVPPTDGESGILTVGSIDCAAPSSTLTTLELPERITLSGLVTDSDGRILPFVDVQARRIPQTNDSIVYVKTATSDLAGNYSLSIDPGTYTLTFIPPSDSGLARAIVRDIQTSTDGVINQQLTSGQSFSGQVVDDDGNPVPWVFIEVFRERPASGSSDAIGSGSCDEDGNFSILIP